MSKIIFGIFAHPDDEAFGPAGTLLMETRNGTELQLFTLTSGAAGTNPDNLADLGAERLKEWQESGRRLGASSMQHLGYADGHLCTEDMIVIQEELLSSIRKTLQENPELSAEIMTFDTNGLTGHIDHIVASRAANYVFKKLKEAGFGVRLRMFCLSRDTDPTENTDWLFMNAGRTVDEIDEIVDARHLRNEILHVMQAHATQKNDYEYQVRHLGDALGLNHFIVRT